MNEDTANSEFQRGQSIPSFLISTTRPLVSTPLQSSTAIGNLNGPRMIQHLQNLLHFANFGCSVLLARHPLVSLE